MARISTYTQVSEVNEADNLLVTDASDNKSTKTVSVKQISDFVLDNEPSDLSLVGINLKWSNDPSWRYESSRVWFDPNLRVMVPLLHMEFENLVIEPDTTYEVVLERSTPKRSKGAQGGYKRGGMKIENPATTEAPYNVRPVSLPITTPQGALYDFKFDWYYRQEFPLLSGYPVPSSVSPNTTRLAIGFRIKKTDSAGVVTYSHSIRKINLIASNTGEDPSTGISFTEL